MVLVNDLFYQSKAKDNQTIASTFDFWQLKIGDRVKHKTLNKYGVIIEKDERKARVKLDLGGISLWAQISEISGLRSSLEQKNNTEAHKPMLNLMVLL